MEMDTSNSTASTEVGIELPDTISQKFTKEQFLRKFKLILSDSLGSQDIEDAWVGYIETVIEPCGWMAVWIPSKKTAEHYEYAEGRAGACVVEVHNVEPQNLLAEVELLKTPNNINIEEKVIRVDISELYPLSNQANSDYMNIEETAEALTLYRCFYKHIWRPWDADEEISNWVQLNLASRVKLMMDHTSKTGSYVIAKRLQHLASEAQRTKDEISELEETAVDLGDEEMDEVHVQLQQLAMRAHEITHEAKLLDDPIYGKLNYSALKAERARQRKEDRVNDTTGIILVWNNGPVKELSAIMNKLSQTTQEDTSLHVVQTLEHALDIALPGDTVVLGQAGAHQMSSIQELGKGGGVIMGLEEENNEERPIIQPAEVTQQLISVSENLLIKNVVINLASMAEKGIVVGERGSITLKNTTIKNGVVGIEMEPWSKATLQDSNFINCYCSVLSHPNSSIDGEGVEIKECKAGHMVYKDDEEYDSVFQIKTTPAPHFKDKIMREDFKKLSRLHRISSSTPKSEAGPLNTAQANLSQDSQTSCDSYNATADIKFRSPTRATEIQNGGASTYSDSYITSAESEFSVFLSRPSIGDSCMTSESSCMTANSNAPVSVGCNSDSKASTIMEC